MDYALAKELKEAGFRQHKSADATCARLHPYRPTLSELIKACGPGRFTLDHQEDGMWEACHVKVVIKHGNVTIIIPRNVYDATENAKKNPAVQKGIKKTFDALAQKYHEP
jgi:hypothetical protein